MIQAIWKYIWGYVIVELRGNALERLLNRISALGIELWDIQRVKQGFRFKMQAKDFYRLRPLVRYRKCTARIYRKRGVPFILYRTWNRKAFLFGIIVCVIVLKLLSSFLWFIDICNTENIPASELQVFVDQMGIHRGMLLKKVDLLGLEQLIRAEHLEVAWVDAKLEGTRLTIKVVEKVLIDETDIVDLVAEKPGVIRELIVFTGRALVKEGDTVNSGDVLIKAATKFETFADPDFEGNLPPYLPPPDGEIIPAAGIVKGHVWYEGYGEAERVVVREQLTGREERAVKIKIGSKLFHYSGERTIPYEQYRVEKEVKSIPLWRNLHLPIEIINEDYLETVIYREPRSLETAYFLAKEQATNAILKSLTSDAIIIRATDFRIDDGDEKNNIVRVKVVMVVEEEIAHPLPRG